MAAKSQPTLWPSDTEPKESLFRGRYPTLWKFWEHGITSSFLDAFLTCREQTRMHYVEGWSSRKVSLALEFGTCCHWILEQAYDYARKGKALAVRPMKPKFPKEMSQQYDHLWKKEVDLPSEKQLSQQEHVLGLAETVLPEYFKRWDGDFTGKYTYGSNVVKPVKWDSLEETFNVPYTFSDGKTVPVRGRRDGVFTDKNGDKWVFDTKCLSIIVEDDIYDTLPRNFQQMLYLWVTWQQTGKMPRGTVLNVIRRPGQRPSAYNTLAALLEKVRSEVTAKKYDYYFIRFQLAVGSDELKAWEKKTLRPIMNDVRGWYEGRIPHYCSDRNLITKYGRCEMFDPIVKGDFSNCYRRQHPFNELRDV